MLQLQYFITSRHTERYSMAVAAPIPSLARNRVRDRVAGQTNGRTVLFVFPGTRWSEILMVASFVKYPQDCDTLGHSTHADRRKDELRL